MKSVLYKFKKDIMPTTWAEINVSALKHNCVAIRKLAQRNSFQIPTRPRLKSKSSIKLLHVVKADAYGHGMIHVGKHLSKWSADSFGVSDVQEGILLRKAGILKPVLLFESLLPEHVKSIVDFDLTPTVCSLKMAQELNQYGLYKKRDIRIHVLVDTGMGRLGVSYDKAFDFIKQLQCLTRLKIFGIYTHFPLADSNRTFTKKQIKQLYELVCSLDRAGLVIPYVHAANSMGLAGFPTKVLNLFRPGLMTYGLYPSVRIKRQIRLKPVMSVYSRVIFLKDIPKGAGISYGHTFVAKKRMKIATIPIGYKDGYSRQLSNKSYVLIQGKKCRVLGHVTMDQMMVDVTSLKNVRVSQKVVILGKDKKAQITADDLARWAGTINYEIICQLGNNIERILVD